jgi:4-hydroxybenzoate polyprenyltransferase
MEITGLIVAILWATMSLLVMIQYAPYCKELPTNDKFIVGLIFIIGGPFFAIANVLEALLDCFLPEGWDEDGPG